MNATKPYIPKPDRDKMSSGKFYTLTYPCNNHSLKKEEATNAKSDTQKQTKRISGGVGFRNNVSKFLEKGLVKFRSSILRAGGQHNIAPLSERGNCDWFYRPRSNHNEQRNIGRGKRVRNTRSQRPERDGLNILAAGGKK